MHGVLGLMSSAAEVLLVKGLALVTIMAAASPAWLLLACEGSLPSLVRMRDLLLPGGFAVLLQSSLG